MGPYGLFIAQPMIWLQTHLLKLFPLRKSNTLQWNLDSYRFEGECWNAKRDHEPHQHNVMSDSHGIPERDASLLRASIALGILFVFILYIHLLLNGLHLYILPLALLFVL